MDASSPTETATFKIVNGVKLAVHVFRPVSVARDSPSPAIIFFFGGGFVGGTPEQFYPHCRYLASRGMVAMAAEYRTESNHGASPFDCVADAKSALRWVRSNARGIGIDPDRIAAGGGSAGGHLAAAAGTLGSFDEPGEDLSVSCRPDALVLFNPVYDNGPGAYGYERVAERWREFSPMHNISAGAPPGIVFFGTEDGLVSIETARAFKRKMEEVGVRSELWVYRNQGHGFFNYRDGDNPCYYATLYQTDRFLASLGYLAGQPTISCLAGNASGMPIGP